jgi:hypothetical protein
MTSSALGQHHHQQQQQQQQQVAYIPVSQPVVVSMPTTQSQMDDLDDMFDEFPFLDDLVKL